MAGAAYPGAVARTSVQRRHQVHALSMHSFEREWCTPASRASVIYQSVCRLMLTSSCDGKAWRGPQYVVSRYRQSTRPRSDFTSGLVQTDSAALKSPVCRIVRPLGRGSRIKNLRCSPSRHEQRSGKVLSSGCRRLTPAQLRCRHYVLSRATRCDAHEMSQPDSDLLSVPYNSCYCYNITIYNYCILLLCCAVTRSSV